MRKSARVLPPLLLLALIACGGAPERPAPRNDLAGVWDLKTVDGAALPAPSPEDPDVTLESVTLTLGGNGEYAVLSAFRSPARQESNEATIGGTWLASDAALTFHGEPGTPAIVEFGYVLEEGRLHLTDEAGHTWLLHRR